MTYRVVFADDDQSIRSLLEHRLSAEGYDCYAAADGDEARDLLDDFDGEPDVVLLDVMMPGTDGRQLLRSIRRGEVGVASDVPVVMLTSRGREEDVLDGLSSGVGRFVGMDGSAVGAPGDVGGDEHRERD